MTPEEIHERLTAWAHECVVLECKHRRRVVCVEGEGPRRTWALWQGSRQVGHVRMRQVNGWTPDWWWAWEASRRTREALGLDDASQSGQTDAHG